MQNGNNRIFENEFENDYLNLANTIISGVPKGENIFMSPVSIALLLKMLMAATDGTTHEEFLNLMFPSQRINIGCAQLRCLSEILESKKGKTNFTTANVVAIGETLKNSIKPEFEDSITSNKNSEIFIAKNMVKKVNNWVKEKTKGMISQIMDEPCDLAFVSAATLVGNWKKQYYEDDIYDGEFRNSSGIIKEVAMLCSEENKYIEDNLCKGFIKPYQGTEYEFLAVLPHRKLMPLSLLIKAGIVMRLTDLYTNALKKKVFVEMPEFAFNTSYDLRELLIDIGIREAFGNCADFSPLTTERVQLSKVSHKAFIDVNRNGTKASAVSIAEIVVAGLPPQEESEFVNLDRPFIFAIMHKKSGLPVFIGAVNDL